jgi:multiple sugar transport system permease protein
VAFLIPYLIFLIIFGILPAAYGIFLSFFQSGISSATKFAGLSNWSAAVSNYLFLPAVEHVGEYLLFWLPILVILTISLSLLLHARPGRLSRVLKFTYYIPGAVTGSAAALLWLFMVTPRLSPVSPLLSALHIASVSSALSGSRLIMVLVVMGVVSSAGGWIVVLYGALDGIPPELLEAAAIDGCSAWQVARHLKMPLVRRYSILILITAFAAGTQLFVEPTVLSAAAPGVISPTWSVNQLALYYATQEGRFGEAASLSILLLAIGLVVALVITFRTHFYSHDPYA